MQRAGCTFLVCSQKRARCTLLVCFNKKVLSQAFIFGAVIQFIYRTIYLWKWKKNGRARWSDTLGVGLRDWNVFLRCSVHVHLRAPKLRLPCPLFCSQSPRMYPYCLLPLFFVESASFSLHDGYDSGAQGVTALKKKRIFSGWKICHTTGEFRKSCWTQK